MLKFFHIKICLLALIVILSIGTSRLSFAATTIPLTVNTSEVVTVSGSPRIAIDVGGITRYATYASGSGTSALIFNYAAQTGDVDLDGITLVTPIDLNGGTITDSSGNPANLTFTLPNTSGVKVNYPSLGMDFVADADGRYSLNGTVYNTLPAFLSATGGTFTRASTATYFNSSGVMQTAAVNTPRFDYNPTTMTQRGLLIEEARTNLILYSSSIIAPWDLSCGGIVDSGATTSAPDGSAVKIFDMSTTSCLFQNITVPAGIPITHSIWIKSNIAATIGFRTPGGVFTSSPINVNTTWQRFTITATSVGTTSRLLVDNRAVNGYGVAGLKLSFFGAQAEQGSFATSHIPTAASTVTRAADVLSIPVGAWYNASTSTLYSKYISNTPSGISTRLASLNNGGFIEVYQIANAASGTVLAQKAFGGSILNSSGPAYSSGTTYTVAGALDAASGPFAVNNVLYSNANAGLPAGLTKIDIGNQNSSAFLNGWISQLKYYPSRVTNTQLQLLSQ